MTTRHVFFDVETSVSTHVSLRKLTLRQYLVRASVLGMALAVDDEDPVWVDAKGLDDPALLAYMRELLADPDTCWVAHNASFDVRVLVHALGLPYPQQWVCTLEAAMCAWPNQPGGYGLESLGQTLHLPSGTKSGKGDKVMRMSADELAAYCIQDTRLCRDIFRATQQRVAPREWEIGKLCSRAKELEFLVDSAAVATAIDTFSANAAIYGAALLDALEDTTGASVGVDDDGAIRSVKPHEVKALLLAHCGFSTQSISAKKVNPVAVAANPTVASALDAATRTNRALSHKRRVVRFAGLDAVDAELNWYAAHTGRFASRATGKGLNLLNLPKHDKDVAKLVRQMFRLPPGYAFVRADEANVEYRVGGLLAKSRHVHALFSHQIMADPYAAFGQSCTGKVVKRTDPSRQLWKAAVLGLEYGMGDERWVGELLRALAKPKPDFTLPQLVAIAEENHWPFPRGRKYSAILTKTGCDPALVTVGYHSRRLFHEIHPEFRQLANWLLEAATLVSAGAGQDAIDALYQRTDAPDRSLLDARVRLDFEGRTLAVALVGWGSPTIYWRDLGVRDVPAYGPCLSFINGKRGYRPLTPSLCIENVTQSAARNRTCLAKLALADRGWPYILNVHDELLPVAPATAEAVCRARSDLLAVLGPDTVHADGFPTWAVVLNPDEVNVSQSWYEVDAGRLDPRLPTNADWWAALPSHPELLENLP